MWGKTRSKKQADSAEYALRTAREMGLAKDERKEK
jgi:hypothetical protein